VDTLIGHSGDVMALAFSPDGMRLASAGYDETVRLWDVSNGKAVQILMGHKGRVYSVAFSPDGKQLASTGTNQLRLWTMPGGELRRMVQFNGQIKTHDGLIVEHLSSVAYSPDGTLIAAGSTTGHVHLLAPTGELLQTLQR